MRLAAEELARVRAIGSRPARSSNRIGRYFRASTRYGKAGVVAATSVTGKSESLNDALSWQEKVDGGAFGALLRSMNRRSEAKAQARPVGGWTKTRPGSLGLLPSGPDP